MKLKTKILTTVLITLMLSLTFSSVISAQSITQEKTESNEEIVANKETPKENFFIPRLIVASVIVNHGFEIISAEADQTQADENGTMYVGNVVIKGKMTGDSYGYACSYIANKIGNRLLNMGKDPSFLPGWYNFEGEFTIKAKMFYLSNYVEAEGAPAVMVGFGFFVRITN